MTKHKKSLISLFIKRATLYKSIVSSIDQIIGMLWIRYPFTTQEKVDKIKKKYSIEEYIKRLTPIIDKMFSEEELQTCIKFYSSDPGRKLFSSVLLMKTKSIGDGIFKDMEQEFSIRNKEQI